MIFWLILEEIDSPTVNGKILVVNLYDYSIAANAMYHADSIIIIKFYFSCISDICKIPANLLATAPPVTRGQDVSRRYKITRSV